MSLHGLLSVTIGVPNVEETAAYYADFGLAPPPSFLHPDDLAAMMTGAHSAR